MESEFEFDISGINGKNSKELESNASPADELFYKGWLLPLQLPLRIHMVEKLDELPLSEIKLHRQRALEADRKFRSEIMSNKKKIHLEDLGFPASRETYEVAADKLGKETCSGGSVPTLEGKKHISFKLKGSKAYLKSLFSNASNHHRQNRIRRENCDEEDAATVAKSTSRENTHAIHRYCKSFSARFASRKELSWVSILNSKPFSSSSRAAPTDGGAILKRSLSSTNSEMENSDIEKSLQEAIAYCKESLSTDPRNRIRTSKHMQGIASDLNGNADGQAI